MFEGADKSVEPNSTGPGEDQRQRRGSGLTGAVDWRLAARTGAAVVPPGPRTTRRSAEQVVQELAEASIRAESPVREVSGLLDDRPIPSARIVDRRGWIDAAADSMATLTGTGVTGGGLLTGKPAGVQAGAMLAFLSTAILGQYDPFTGEDGTLLLVAPNIVAVERALGVSPSDFRFWVCLHEVTHRVQFSSAPWLADYMRANVDILGAAGSSGTVPRGASSACCAPPRPPRSARRSTGCSCSAPCSRATRIT